jgi:IclR family pca regulon transcriptional regulator
VVYVARIPPKHLSFLPVTLGTRMPAHVNAMGQVLLAQLDPRELDDYFRNAKFEKITKYTLTDERRIRSALARAARNGFALSDRQLQVGLRSIAVGIPSKLGRSEAALNVSADVSRATKADLVRRFLPVLQRAAAQLAHVS